MRMYVDGSWVESATAVPVISPFGGEQVDSFLAVHRACSGSGRTPSA